MKNFVEQIGHWLKNILTPLNISVGEMGGMVNMSLSAIKGSVSAPIRWRLMMDQMRFIGVGSFFIVVLTALFSGMVFALQSGRAFALFQAETLTGAVVMMTISRELAPVLTALMVTARAGSAMAAQLGTMQITQQVDALISMSVDPIDYLISPRIVATTLVVPILTAIYNFVGIVGAYVVSIYLLNIDEGMFLEKIRLYTDVGDFVQGLFKSIFFGFILATISCYKGFSAKRGALDVGEKVTQAVVISSVSILVADYFLTALFF